MKPIAGTFLLLFPLVMTGCGKQNPAGPGTETAPTVLVPEGLNERHAASFLSGARELHKNGESEQAIEALTELLTLYPKSNAADEARELLSDLKPQSFDVGDHNPGEIVTVRGLLTHFPQEVKSIEAWLGHEFMVGETPIRTTDKVPRDLLITMVGQNVQIEGIWNAGKKSKPPKPEDEEYELQTPLFPKGQTIVREAGIEASAVKKIEE